MAAQALLNPLRAVEAVARHLNFTLAARELHVTPGAVGQQVKAPEDRSERIENGSGADDFLICPEGTAGCPEIESLRAWLEDADAAGASRRGLQP